MTGSPSAAAVAAAAGAAASDDDSDVVVASAQDQEDDPTLSSPGGRRRRRGSSSRLSSSSLIRPNHVSHHNFVSQQHSMAWDLAPIVASPDSTATTLVFQNHTANTHPGPYWKARSCRQQTPQHISSILLLSSLETTTDRKLDTSSTIIKEDQPQDNASSSSRIASVQESDCDETMDEESVTVPTSGGEDTSTMAGDASITTAPTSNTSMAAAAAAAANATSSVDLSSTTNCSCPPILWNQEYLLVALTNGEIRLYGNLLARPESSLATTTTLDPSAISTAAPPAPAPPRTIHTPLASLALNSDATLVQLLVLPTTDDSTAIFLALSVEGHVHQFRFWRAVEPAADGGEDLGTSYHLELEHSWNTGSCGPTCMVVASLPQLLEATPSQQQKAKASSKQTSEELYLWIGYTSSVLECWKLVIVPSKTKMALTTNESSLSSSSSSPATAPSQLRRRPTRPRRSKPDCLWKGYVEEPYSIQSLQILLQQSPVLSGSTLTRQQDEADSINQNESVTISSSPTVSDRAAEPSGTTLAPIMVVTLQTPIGEDESPIFQALDLTAIHRQASKTQPRHMRNDDDDDAVTLALGPFRLLPDPAMSLIESSSLSSSGRVSSTILLPPEASTQQPEGSTPQDAASYMQHQVPTKLNSTLIPSRGTNGSIALGFKNHSKCGVALSNGTVAILSPGWGVASDADQLLFSYPVIGMGRIVVDHEDNKKEYLVCCLRAGTCYLIPIAPTTSTESPEIVVDDDIVCVSYPHDIDADTTNLYVQEFTAGMLQNDNNKNKVLGVLVYVWPGGVVDIYSIELLLHQAVPVAPPSQEDQLLQELIQQGCLNMTLKSLDGQYPVEFEYRELWDASKKELSDEKDVPKSMEDLKGFPALQALLLKVATVE